MNKVSLRIKVQEEGCIDYNEGTNGNIFKKISISMCSIYIKYISLNLLCTIKYYDELENSKYFPIIKLITETTKLKFKQ